MKDLLVIGGASLDILHFAGRIATAAGGAGMYTAAAAHQSGASVTMLAPRPDPVPDPLRPVAARVEWLGPLVQPDQMPHFEIAHYGSGKARLVNALWGAEAVFSPDDLPVDLSTYRLVHIAALRSALRQLQFLLACRERGARCISVGTYARVVEREAENVQSMLEQADLFFMNENEACALFGSSENAYITPGRCLFVTLGEKGVLVVQGGYVTQIRAPQVDELDPTGAGDTFCGATLAGLVRGDHPIIAARKAVAVAAHMIEAIGPTALWREVRLGECNDYRVVVNPIQIGRLAEVVRDLKEVKPFDFVGSGLPPVGHPGAQDFFFAATLQQFGFWDTKSDRYRGPLLAPIADGVRKGSDYLWHAYLRCLNLDATCCSPYRQAQLTRKEMLVMFRSDDGTDIMPALDLRLEQARSYGRDMLELDLLPKDLVARANLSRTPLLTFIESLDRIGGYKEDPFRKKTSLLALILSGRPEKFLQLEGDAHIPPIIDYHLMRSCLRIGLVDVVDADLRHALVERHLLTPMDEWAVRQASYDAISRLAALSGKSMAAVDWFLFNSRHRCPEMSIPQCAECPVDPVCNHRKELFQPVLRTPFY